MHRRIEVDREEGILIGVSAFLPLLGRRLGRWSRIAKEVLMKDACCPDVRGGSLGFAVKGSEVRCLPIKGYAGTPCATLFPLHTFSRMLAGAKKTAIHRALRGRGSAKIIRAAIGLVTIDMVDDCGHGFQLDASAKSKDYPMQQVVLPHQVDVRAVPLVRLRSDIPSSHSLIDPLSNRRS